MGEKTLDSRRKRLLFRSRHRGMQETDILLGGFARRHLSELTGEQLDQFETLLEESDNDLFDWITGRTAVPPALDNGVMKLLRNFKNSL